MTVLAAAIVPHPPIILPEVGRGEEQKIQKTIDAYREAARRIAILNPDTVIIASPHATLYGDYFHISPGEGAQGGLRQFGIHNLTVTVSYDGEFVQQLSEMAVKRGLPAGTLGEREKELDHGTLIPVRFLQEQGVSCPVVRIGLSGLSLLEHYRLGQCIAAAATNLNRRVVFVASGDLSHKLTIEGPYGFAAEGPEFDREVTEAMAAGDFLRLMTFPEDFCEAAAECGLRSFVIMAGALDGRAVQPELLSYEGTFGVGYAVGMFTVTGSDDRRRFDVSYERQERERLDRIKAQEDVYVRLARLSLETYLRTGTYARLPDDLPAELRQRKAGVFVSLKKQGRLRGCIGTILPVTESVAAEIVRNAVSAGTEDPRFDPVTERELADLAYSVDVLSEPEAIESADQLNVKRYGVIVTSGRKRGLLLPNLEGVRTVNEQISIALEKAGIAPGQPYSLERFEVVRHT